MAERTLIRLRALVLFAAPVTLLVAFILHPYLSDEFDISAMSAKVAADPGRWALAHVMLMVGFGLMMLAVFALRELLRKAGEERWSFIAVPLLIGGGTMMTGIWGLEVAVAAVANVGGDVEAVFDDSDKWFGPVGIAGFAMLALGWISMAPAVHRSHVLGRRQTWVVLAATVVMLAGLLIPATGGAYLFTFGMMGFTWMLAYQALSGASGLSGQSSGAAAP